MPIPYRIGKNIPYYNLFLPTRTEISQREKEIDDAYQRGLVDEQEANEMKLQLDETGKFTYPTTQKAQAEIPTFRYQEPAGAQPYKYRTGADGKIVGVTEESSFIPTGSKMETLEIPRESRGRQEINKRNLLYWNPETGQYERMAIGSEDAVRGTPPSSIPQQKHSSVTGGKGKSVAGEEQVKEDPVVKSYEIQLLKRGMEYKETGQAMPSQLKSEVDRIRKKRGLPDMPDKPQEGKKDKGLYEKTIEIWNKFFGDNDVEGEFTDPTKPPAEQKNPFEKEYPDAFFENGQWKVTRNGKKYRIEP